MTTTDPTEPEHERPIVINDDVALDDLLARRDLVALYWVAKWQQARIANLRAIGSLRKRIEFWVILGGLSLWIICNVLQIIATITS